MKKLKEKWENNEIVIFIKAMWANKRYRSLVLLGGYLIFFVILGIMFRAVPNNSEISNKPSYGEADIKEILQNKSSKDYSYTLTINESIIEGNVSGGTNSLFYQNNEYVIVSNKLYQNQEGNLMHVENFLETLLPIEKINLATISEILKDRGPTKENITEDNFELSYQVLASEFVENDNNIVNIKINGKEEKIEKIELNYQTDNYILKIKE